MYSLAMCGCIKPSHKKSVAFDGMRWILLNTVLFSFPLLLLASAACASNVLQTCHLTNVLSLVYLCFFFGCLAIVLGIWAHQFWLTTLFNIPLANWILLSTFCYDKIFKLSPSSSKTLLTLVLLSMVNSLAFYCLYLGLIGMLPCYLWAYHPLATCLWLNAFHSCYAVNHICGC